MLLSHLSRPNVRRYGVEIKGEAVVHGEHTLYLIVESGDEAAIGAFMAPFGLAGSVEVYPASTCAGVVAGGGCGAAPPLVDAVPALDPEEACQHAIEAGLVVHRAHPLNCETSIAQWAPGADRRGGDAERALLRAQPLPDPPARGGDVAARRPRPGGTTAEPEPAGPPQPALAEPGGHPGVRRQRPLAAAAAETLRAFTADEMGHVLRRLG